MGDVTSSDDDTPFTKVTALLTVHSGGVGRGGDTAVISRPVAREEGRVSSLCGGDRVVLVLVQVMSVW